MRYFISRKYRQIATIIWWLPKIWNNFDFDHSYSTMMMINQLERQADFLESSEANTRDASFHATKIRLFIRLYHKVYNDDYFNEFYNSKNKTADYFKNYIEHADKAHRILWAFFEHNVQKWRD